MVIFETRGGTSSIVKVNTEMSGGLSKVEMSGGLSKVIELGFLCVSRGATFIIRAEH